MTDRSEKSIINALKTLAKEAGNLFSTVFKSTTEDNGSEFSARKFGRNNCTSIYFAFIYI